MSFEYAESTQAPASAEPPGAVLWLASVLTLLLQWCETAFWACPAPVAGLLALIFVVLFVSELITPDYKPF